MQCVACCRVLVCYLHSGIVHPTHIPHTVDTRQCLNPTLDRGLTASELVFTLLQRVKEAECDPTKRFKLEDTLGKGAFATVYRALDRTNKTHVVRRSPRHPPTHPLTHVSPPFPSPIPLPTTRHDTTRHTATHACTLNPPTHYRADDCVC